MSVTGALPAACRLPADRQTVPFASQELFDEFQDLIPWADGIFDKHFS
jgi:hypothetical protein